MQLWISSSPTSLLSFSGNARPRLLVSLDYFVDNGRVTFALPPVYKLFKHSFSLFLFVSMLRLINSISRSICIRHLFVPSWLPLSAAFPRGSTGLFELNYGCLITVIRIQTCVGSLIFKSINILVTDNRPSFLIIIYTLPSILKRSYSYPLI